MTFYLNGVRVTKQRGFAKFNVARVHGNVNIGAGLQMKDGLF